MTSVEFRPATTEDTESINRVIVAAKSSWDYDEAYLRAAIPLVRVVGDYVAENLCSVAHSASEIVAFGAVEVHDGNPAVLEHLWVAPAFHGQGIGASLFRSLCEAARGAGCRSLKIASDPPAVGFYTRLGAALVDEVSSRVPGGPRFPVLRFDLANAVD
jgi:predicted N-acetyltransferase YhbS